MHVISYKAIREFVEDHPAAEIKLRRWYKWMKRGKYKNSNEIKKKFKGVDYIGNDRYVFNISGNKYRLVAVIFLTTKILLIRFIGTHAEYDKINASKI